MVGLSQKIKLYCFYMSLNFLEMHTVKEKLLQLCIKHFEFIPVFQLLVLVLSAFIPQAWNQADKIAAKCFFLGYNYYLFLYQKY